jgi:hypothetical protein
MSKHLFLHGQDSKCLQLYLSLCNKPSTLEDASVLLLALYLHFPKARHDATRVERHYHAELYTKVHIIIHAPSTSLDIVSL